MDTDVEEPKEEDNQFYLRVTNSSDQTASDVPSLLERAADQIKVYEERYTVQLLGVQCNVGSGVTHPFIEVNFYDWDHWADFGLVRPGDNEVVNEENHPLFGTRFKPPKTAGDESSLRLIEIGPSMRQPHSLAELFQKAARVLRELSPGEILSLVVVEKLREEDMDDDVFGVHVFYREVSASEA